MKTNDKKLGIVMLVSLFYKDCSITISVGIAPGSTVEDSLKELVDNHRIPDSFFKYETRGYVERTDWEYYLTNPTLVWYHPKP